MALLAGPISNLEAKNIGLDGHASFNQLIVVQKVSIKQVQVLHISKFRSETIFLKILIKTHYVELRIAAICLPSFYSPDNILFVLFLP